VCRQHNVLIFEDEAHAVLALEATVTVEPFCYGALGTDRQFEQGGFGRSAGWLFACTATLIGRLSASVRGTCWMASPLALEVASLWIENGIAEQLLNEQINEISRRKALVEKSLEGLDTGRIPIARTSGSKCESRWRASQVAEELKENNYLIATAEKRCGRACSGPAIRAGELCVIRRRMIGCCCAGFEALTRALTKLGIETPCRSCRRLRSFDFDLKNARSKESQPAGSSYLKRRSTPFSTRIFAEISSTEKCVELIFGMFSRRRQVFHFAHFELALGVARIAAVGLALVCGSR